LDDLETKARALTPRSLLTYLDPVVPVRGLLGGSGIEKLFSELLGDKRADALPRPFAAVATDLASGEQVILSGGRLVDAVRASCAVPGIFTPFEQDGRFLVDGGLVNPVPVDVVRAMGADIVIAVDLNHDLVDCPWCAVHDGQTAPAPALPRDNSDAESGFLAGLEGAFDDAMDKGDRLRRQAMNWVAKASRPNVFDVIGGAINSVEAQLTRVNLSVHPPDILIQPPLGHMALWDFADAGYAIETGKTAAEKALQEHFS